MTSQVTTHATIDPAVTSPRERAGLWARCDDRRARVRFYIALTLTLYVVAWGLVLIRAHVKRTKVDFALSDAVGLYAYLPSVVIDGDLRFENQLQAQFRGTLPEGYGEQSDGEGWAVSARRNRWPVGVALTLSPAFVVAHGLSHLLHAMTGWDAFEPNGYTTLYFVFCVALAMAIGAAGMIVADRLLTERYHLSGRATAAAVLTWWLGTNYLWFFVREPLVAHMIGASLVTFAAYLLHRIDVESREGTLVWWHLPALAFFLALAVACRFTNALFAPLAICAVFIIARHRLLKRAMMQVPLVALAAAPLVVQAIILHLMSGQVVQRTPQALGYPRWERFYWSDPALFLSLFSSRRGLFFWTPVLLLSAWGLFRYAVRDRGWRDPLIVSLLMSAAALWYVNASWYAWWLGNSVGNRGFIELGVLFIAGFGFAYARVEQFSVRARRAVAVFVLFGAMVNLTFITLKLLGRLESHGPLLTWENRVFTGSLKRF
jgi:hypothetical protein